MFHPRWMFHALAAARLVSSQEELTALGVEWGDSPAAAQQIADALAAAPALSEQEQKAADEEAELARMLAEEQIFVGASAPELK